MTKIVQFMTLLLSLTAFIITAAVGLAAGVEPVVVLLRGTIALVIFGIIGIFFFQMIGRSVLIELARLQYEKKKKLIEERKKEREKALNEQNEETAAY